MSSRGASRWIGPRAKAFVGTVAEHAWAAAFSALGIFLPRRPARWQSSPPLERVLVVAPHPDDESIGCAGTILLHKQAGAHVTVAWVTDGRTSRAHGLEPEDMARRRRLEADESARVLGVDRLEWIGLRSGEWSDDAFLTAVGGVMAHDRPDIVYAPSCIDFHPEHTRVARLLARLWASSPVSIRPATVRVYPVQVPLTSVLANVVVDVTRVIAQARAAMDAHTTQLANMPRAVRQRMYAARRYRIGAFAEEFWQVSGEAYSRLHLGEEGHDAAGVRGIRANAVSDPLAYVLGRQARRRLAATFGV